MRLTQKKIEEILIRILGEEGMPLVQELLGKKNVSEFDLAIRTKQDIKIVRRQLYNLYNHNLVGFTRKKDKIKGWYIYYWTLLPESIRFNYFKMKRDLLARLKNQLEKEEKELFFVSPDGSTRMNFDQAMEFDFRCPDTGELLMQDNSEERKFMLKNKIEEVQAELNLLIAEREVSKKEIKPTTKKNKTADKSKNLKIKTKPKVKAKMKLPVKNPSKIKSFKAKK